MYINVNNINIYYEVYGDGKPIVLLHGNSESHDVFDKLIESLKSQFKVYAIDSRCHGKSDNPDEISYDLMADDIVKLIQKLEIDKPILYGFSDGGIVGLLVAIKEPSLLSKLIVSGANLNPQNLKKKSLIITKIAYLFNKSKLFKMMLDEPNIEVSELNKIQVPTIVLAGEKDIIKKEHTKLISDNIPNSKMEIIPNENHGSYVVHSDKIYYILKKYIDE